MSGYRVQKWNEAHLPNAAMLRHILTSEGFRVNQWCDRPGGVYPNHKHAEDQSHWVISGSIEITVERVGSFILEAGDRDFMAANTYHTARVVGEEPVLYLIGEKI